MKPKGTLVAIGGSIEMDISKPDGEIKSFHQEEIILPELIKYAGGPNKRIELITCASGVPDKVWENYCKTLNKLGANNSDNLIIYGRDEANSTRILKRIENADLLLFSGGNQRLISENLVETKTHDLIYSRYLHDNIIIAGTSAGAMSLPEIIITGEKHGSIFESNGLEIGKGLGLIKQVVIDTHFTQRGRLERLANAVALYPDKLGIGIDEKTGIAIREGNICEVIGKGKVILINGSRLNLNNAGENSDESAEPLFNLIVHILYPKDKYYISEKKAVSHNKTRQYQS